jgi:hypothetical protein
VAASDLAQLADVKAWLAGSSGIGAGDDVLLARLITDVSGAIAAYLGRPFILPRSWSERYDGNGKTRLYLRSWPVLSVASLVVGDTTIAAAPTPGAGVSWQAGYLLDPWDGTPPGIRQALDLRGHCYWGGRQNVLVSYMAGYQVTAEAATVPASTAYTVTPLQPFGPWASDSGVSYANGTALTLTTNAPTQGQYQITLNPQPDQSPPTWSIKYTFAAADAGAAVLISYGFIPAALNNACIEWVAERYRYRTRIGQSAQTVAGQMTSAYSLKDMPDFIRTSLDPFRNVVPF